MMDWVKGQKIEGLTLDFLEEPKRTPLIFIQVEGTDKTQETVLMYSHLDKQPPFLGWHDGLSPYSPKLKDGKVNPLLFVACTDSWTRERSCTVVAALTMDTVCLLLSALSATHSRCLAGIYGELALECAAQAECRNLR